MLSLISKTRAAGVIFISGDLHYGELSEVNPADHPSAPYTMHDLCSSGLTMTWPTVALNRHRVAGPVTATNWGAVRIDFEAEDPRIELSLHDAQTGEHRVGLSLSLSALRPQAECSEREAEPAEAAG